MKIQEKKKESHKQQAFASKSSFDSRVTVNLLGREYTLKGDVDSDYMIKISKYVDQRLRELQDKLPCVDLSKLCLLAALNLADELFQARQDESRVDIENLSEMASKAENLIQMLEDGIIGANTYH